MRECGDYGKPHGIRLVLENHFGTMTTTAARTAEIIKEIDHPNVGILYDQANIAFFPAEEYPEDGFDFVMNLNVKALFLLSREIGGYMKTRRWGRIINVCSIQSMQGGNGVSAYAASKHAVAGITRAFANEWGSMESR